MCLLVLGLPFPRPRTGGRQPVLYHRGARTVRHGRLAHGGARGDRRGMTGRGHTREKRGVARKVTRVVGVSQLVAPACREHPDRTEMPESVSEQSQRGRSGSGSDGCGTRPKRRKVPLRTIIAAILRSRSFYLSGQALLYRLRDVLLLLLCSQGSSRVILNPVVRRARKVRREAPRVRRHAGGAAGAPSSFVGLAFAFGYPLVNAITNFADRLPSFVTSAESGRGWIGQARCSAYLSVQQWGERRTRRSSSRSGRICPRPALALGKGALSLLVELATIFILMLLLLLEGPRLRRGILSVLSPGQAGGGERRSRPRVERARSSGTCSATS